MLLESNLSADFDVELAFGNLFGARDEQGSGEDSMPDVQRDLGLWELRRRRK